MGGFSVRIEVGDYERRRFEPVEALVDTVVFGDDALLGAVTLEELRLAPDPVHQRLLRVPALLKRLAA
jgi:hypothetical protein